MEIKPLGDRIVVKPLEAEAKSKGGIVLPDTAKEKPSKNAAHPVLKILSTRLAGLPSKPRRISPNRSPTTTIIGICPV